MDVARNQEVPGVDPKLRAYVTGKHQTNEDFFEAAPEFVGGVQRVAWVAARIVPRDGAGAKVGAAAPFGGINSRVDDRGHLAPEKGVSDRHSMAVNGPNNVVAENWVVNQKYKTAFEQGVKNLAKKGHHVVTIHIPHYDPTPFGGTPSTRPSSITHYAAVDGKILSAFTFANPPGEIKSRPR